MQSKKTLSKSNILFLTHTYTSFEKDQIETIAQYFRHVYVLVRYKPIADIGAILPITFFQTHRKEFVFQLRGKPENVTVIPVPLWYFPTDWGYKRLGKQHVREVEKLIRQHNIQFDLVHAHFLWSAGFVGSVLKQRYGVPFIVTAHGYDVYRLPFKSRQWREKISQVVSHADTVITVSQANAEYLTRLGCADSSIFPNGFNEQLFFPKPQAECRKRLDLPVDRKILVSVGALKPVKGHAYLIESMQELIRKEPRVLCLILGNGELQVRLQRQIASLNLQQHVKLVGEKLHHEIPDWINAGDLFVLPSLSESFGVVQLEAMACGKPVVATINGGSEELITSRDFGLLCEKANQKALAATILAALEKSWDESKIREYAANYTLDEVCKNIVTIYRDML